PRPCARAQRDAARRSPWGRWPLSTRVGDHHVETWINRTDADMKISVQGKQLDVGDALRERIETTIGQIAAKYFSNPIDATVTVSRDGVAFRTDVNVHVGKGISVSS